MDVLEVMKKETRRRGYTHRTTVTYVQCMKQFLSFCPKDPKRVTTRDVQLYLDSLLDNGCGGSTLNVHIHALKFVFEQILRKRITIRIRCSRKPKRLPVFLTRREIVRLFDVVENERHKLALELLYSAGLRVGEVVCLRRRDFDFDRFIGWVRQGKGRRDRPFIIARCLALRLKAYVVASCSDPASYLFNGRHGHMSTRTIQEIINRAAKKAKIDKRVHPHALRHSFATHLIEDGYDVAAVQPLLGHVNATTTLTYVHMARPTLISVRSPYDCMIQNRCTSREGWKRK